ncbi:MAG: AraC family transcriptional regulator [Defluviitaleaceae bacterium]|nr:AraC family transcriptional regulator [Defluviitaleaceae bacterium]
MSDSFEFSSEGVEVRHIRIEDPPVFRPQIHYMHEFYFFISGQGQFYVEGNPYQLQPGCVILIRAGEAHYAHLAQEPYEWITILFHPSFLAGIDPNGLLSEPFQNRLPGHRNFYPPEDIRQKSIGSCLDAIFGKYGSSPNSDDDMRFRILCNLPALLFEFRQRFYDVNAVPAEIYPDMTSRVVAYINEHLTEPFQLQALADLFFVNSVYMNRKFKQTTGFTICQYIISKRLFLAHQQISEGVSPVKAAEESGWKDYSAFYRQYKTRFGVSPKAGKTDSIERVMLLPNMQH